LTPLPSTVRDVLQRIKADVKASDAPDRSQEKDTLLLRMTLFGLPYDQYMRYHDAICAELHAIGLVYKESPTPDLAVHAYSGVFVKAAP
jgi:hypothetical protein